MGVNPLRLGMFCFLVQMAVLRLFCFHLTLFFISGSEAFPLACTEDLLDSAVNSQCFCPLQA